MILVRDDLTLTLPERRIPRNALLAITLAALIPTALPGQSAISGSDVGPRVPAITGTVIDALTGKPLSGVNVILRGDLLVASFGDGGREPLRHETSTTSAGGRFGFPAKVESKAAGPLASISGLSLSVEGRASDGAGDPMRSPKVIVGTAEKKSYFPILVELIGDCENPGQVAACISLSPMGDVRVPLFPVVDDPAQCKQIANAEWSEKCRQLNTYRAAFVHLETIEQIRNDKKLCRSVDQGIASKQCLGELRREVRDRATAREGVIPQPGTLPPGEVLITSITGLVAGPVSVSRFDPFEEMTNYSISYKLEVAPADNPVTVTVAVGAREATSDDVASQLDSRQPIPVFFERSGVFEGHHVMVIDVGTVSMVAWSSGNRIVCVDFNGLMPAALPLASRRELIRRYMQKYPSSN